MIAVHNTSFIEMNEVATILNNATAKSLVLLDEVGRGTGTRDGLALAVSIISYITNKIGCTTMFATHFHELANLADQNARIRNLRALTTVIDGDIVFLHKVERGKEEHSFGIEVAKMAGMPKEVLDEARRLYSLDRAQQLMLKKEGKGAQVQQVKEVVVDNPVVAKLQDIDVNRMSPMETFIFLGDLVKEAKK